jgi:hypothetical protein
MAQKGPLGFAGRLGPSFPPVRGYKPVVHSQTFPNVSYRPQPFACFCLTAAGPWRPLLSAYQAMAFRAPYRAATVPARAAYSHSSSDGSLPPAALQKAAASSHVKFTIGRVLSRHPGFQSESGGMLALVAATNRLYAPTVTSVCPIHNPCAIVTACDVCSPRQSVSPCEQPIGNVPAGIHAYCSLSLELALTSPAFKTVRPCWPAAEAATTAAQVREIRPLRSIIESRLTYTTSLHRHGAELVDMSR